MRFCSFLRSAISSAERSFSEYFLPRLGGGGDVDDEAAESDAGLGRRSAADAELPAGDGSSC